MTVVLHKVMTDHYEIGTTSIVTYRNPVRGHHWSLHTHDPADRAWLHSIGLAHADFRTLTDLRRALNAYTATNPPPPPNLPVLRNTGPGQYTTTDSHWTVTRSAITKHWNVLHDGEFRASTRTLHGARRQIKRLTGT